MDQNFIQWHFEVFLLILPRKSYFLPPHPLPPPPPPHTHTHRDTHTETHTQRHTHTDAHTHTHTHTPPVEIITCHAKHQYLTMRCFFLFLFYFSYVFWAHPVSLWYQGLWYLSWDGEKLGCIGNWHDLDCENRIGFQLFLPSNEWNPTFGRFTLIFTSPG